MNTISIEENEPRTEIIRVRFTSNQKKQFAAYSTSIGMCSATVAYKLAMSAMSAHVRPRPSGAQGTIRRPLKPIRSQSCPGAKRYPNGKPRPHLLV